MADHGAKGPEVVVAVGGQHHRGDGPSSGTVSSLVLHGVYPQCRRSAGLASIRRSYTLEVFAARCSTQTPWGVPPVTGGTATNKPGPSREHRNGRDTTSKQGRKGDSPSSGAAGEHHAARRAPVAWTRYPRGSPGNHRRRQAIHSCSCMQHIRLQPPSLASQAPRRHVHRRGSGEPKGPW